MSSQSGIIFRGLMTTAGLSDNDAFINATAIFASTFVLPLIVISVLLFVFGRHRTMGTDLGDVTKPEPLTSQQKTTLVLTLVMMAVVLAAPIANLIAPDNATVNFINSKINIGLIASVFSVIALLLKLGDERKAISSLSGKKYKQCCGKLS